MLELEELRKIGVENGLDTGMLYVEWIDEIPATHSQIYGKQFSSSVVDVNRNGQLTIFLSKFLKKSERRLALIRALGYADFYRRNQFITDLMVSRSVVDLSTYNEKYGSSLVEAWIKAFESISFTTKHGTKFLNLYRYILTYNDRLLPWQRQLGEELLLTYQKEFMNHSTALLREGWARLHEHVIINALEISEKEKLELIHLIAQKDDLPLPGIHIGRLGKQLLIAAPKKEHDRIIRTYDDRKLIEKFYTERIHRQERISVLFTETNRLQTYKDVKNFLIGLASHQFYPILVIDHQKTTQTGELTIYYQSWYPIHKRYLQQVRQHLEWLWGGKVFMKPNMNKE